MFKVIQESKFNKNEQNRKKYLAVYNERQNILRETMIKKSDINIS